MLPSSEMIPLKEPSKLGCEPVGRAIAGEEAREIARRAKEAENFILGELFGIDRSESEWVRRIA